jgi:hypothetical protein
MRAVLLLTVAFALAYPSSAIAHEECGNPPGPAENVTATKVSCSDARAFARKVTNRGITRSGYISLPGWRRYYATVRRVNGKYDVRASRGSKVIRFQFRKGTGSGGGCDPSYRGACLDPTSPDYDCAGGSGDGPDYTGPVEVVGDDHFGLDRDGDGFGCEDS